MNDTKWAGAVAQARPSPSPKDGSPLLGYSSEFNQQQHVIYLGADNHVYELYNLNAWKFNDLTQLTGSPNAGAASALDGYVTSFNHQQHVNFIGDDNVREIYYDGFWKANNLDGNVLFRTPLAGYQTGFNDQQHVIYLDANDRIVELLYDGKWNPAKDLTDDVNSRGAKIPQPLRGTLTGRQFCGYSTEFNRQQHVIFLGNDEATGSAHIYELYFADGAWNGNDLTRAAGPDTPLPAPDGALTAYPTEFDEQHHVIFFGKDSRTYELYYHGSSWHWNDLTKVFGDKPPTPVIGALTGYSTGFDRQQHVMFVGAGKPGGALRIYEIYYSDGAWHGSDVTSQLVGASPPAPVVGSALKGYATDYDRAQHVIYIGSNAGANNIIELHYANGSWQSNNLTMSAVIPIIRAEGIWKVPFVSTPDQPQSSQGGWQSCTWVGIDGQATNDVLQAGTEQEVDKDGIGTTYYAWFEWFAPEESGSPDYRKQTQIPEVPVSPGDQISCKAEYIDNNSLGRVTLKNLTSGAGFTRDLEPPREAGFDGNTAEWIMEAPTHNGTSIDSLPDFSPVDFVAGSAMDIAGALFDPQNAPTVEIVRGGKPMTSTTTPLSGEVNITYVP